MLLFFFPKFNWMCELGITRSLYMLRPMVGPCEPFGNMMLAHHQQIEFEMVHFGTAYEIEIDSQHNDFRYQLDIPDHCLP